MSELGTAFDKVKTDTGKVPDLIGFDACMMGYSEVAFQIRKYASVMVGSEELEWEVLDSDPSDGYAGGWPYDRILQNLTYNPAMTAEGLGAVMVNSYASFWGPNPGNNDDYTMSALRTSYVEDLTYRVNLFANSLIGLLPSYAYQIGDVRFNTETFALWADKGCHADLYDFMDLLQNSGIPIGRGMSTIANKIKNDITSMVIAEWHSTTRSNAHGVGIYFPNYYQTYNAGYANIDFSKDPTYGAPNWNAFLIALQPY